MIPGVGRTTGLKTSSENGPFCPTSEYYLPLLSTPSTSSSTMLPTTMKTSTTTQMTSTSTTTTTRPPTTVSICPENYQIFQRGNVSVCVGVEYPPGINSIIQEQGSQMCTQAGGFISGPDSLEERDYLRDQIFGKIMKATVPWANMGVWVDGARKPSCIGSPWIVPAACKTIAAFTFSDKTMLSQTGYTFYTGQPDGSGNPQNCLQMMVINTIQNGMIDDLGCQTIFGYGVYSTAVICAKLV